MLQDHYIEDDKVDISIIKSTNGNLEYYKENNGKIWIVDSEDIILRKKKLKQNKLGVILWYIQIL